MTSIRQPICFAITKKSTFQYLLFKCNKLLAKKDGGLQSLCPDSVDCDRTEIERFI